jgi:hypothetical protein
MDEMKIIGNGEDPYSKRGLLQIRNCILVNS